MNPPVGDPKTCPAPLGSGCGLAVGANTVSLVPSEMPSCPGDVRPRPTSDDGLSPVQVMTRAGPHPSLRCQYGASTPATVHGVAIAGSFGGRSGAVASIARAAHVPAAMFIRFIPEP